MSSVWLSLRKKFLCLVSTLRIISRYCLASDLILPEKEKVPLYTPAIVFSKFFTSSVIELIRSSVVPSFSDYGFVLGGIVGLRKKSFISLCILEITSFTISFYVMTLRISPGSPYVCNYIG
jgi:hypothetical protein